jgi:hypothetical protein
MEMHRLGKMPKQRSRAASEDPQVRIVWCSSKITQELARA